jgi:hypothetical protein
MEEDPWKINDANWFKANPSRSHRLRSVFPGEIKTLSSFDVPPGHELQVLVRQLEPGHRVRIGFCRNLELPIPDVESLIHAMFDIVVENDAKSFTVEKVAKRALEYEKAFRKK